ncbi:MAG TPA: acyl carrier protein [Proteobacteria bacterium]|nr:acyl carrier protein [Pseudomonadota bacterium]
MDEELEELTEQIKEIIANTFDIDLEEIEDDSFLSDDLGADPTLLEELADALTEEFEIEINDDDIEEWETVADVIETVLSRLNEA